jgi:hypothetical protein
LGPFVRVRLEWPLIDDREQHIDDPGDRIASRSLRGPLPQRPRGAALGVKGAKTLI